MMKRTRILGAAAMAVALVTTHLPLREVPALAIGVVGDQYYYRRNLKTGEKEFVSVRDNLPVIIDPLIDSTKQYMSKLADAWYETAKYMLLNNKKKKGVMAP